MLWAINAVPWARIAMYLHHVSSWIVPAALAPI